MQRVEKPAEWADTLDRPISAEGAMQPSDAELETDASNFQAFASAFGVAPPPSANE